MVKKHSAGCCVTPYRVPDRRALSMHILRFSFPSGHTTASFSFFAVALLRCSTPVWTGIFILAVLMGFSRVYLRVHYLTDVLVGAVLGFLCGSASVALLNYIMTNFGII